MFSTTSSTKIDLNNIETKLKIKEASDHYEIRYPVKFIPQNVSFRKSFGEQDEGFFKIRKEDLENKGWSIESKELQNYIKNGLKILIGFDFDQTLSNNHTWYAGKNTSFSNLKGGETTQKTLSQLDKQNNLHLFVATNNFKEPVIEHLTAWQILPYFKQTLGRNEFHGSSGDKEICFRKIYDEVKSNSALDNGQFLMLNAPDKTINVIAGVLLDDDVRYNSIKKFGIKFINVSTEENNISHLRKLKDYCSERIEIPELASGTKRKDNPSSEINDHLESNKLFKGLN